jgi:large subunit ribosomal protein L22
MQVRAYAKNIRISPQKARLVTNLIYGLPATEALRTLQFTQKKAARIIENVVKSAIANAKVQGIAKDDLKISKAVADEGMRLKRFKPDARGRVGHRTHRYSHITIMVSDE